MRYNGYLNNTELTKRWSPGLVKKFFPKASLECMNPHYRNAAPMLLYSMSEIRKIEERADFKEAFVKAMHFKEAGKNSAEYKRKILIDYASTVKIKLPELEWRDAVAEALYEYNERNKWKETEYCNYSKATESGDKDFLKRIVINHIRHRYTDYDKNMKQFFAKVGVQEAHDILKDRINKEIEKKYKL